MATNNKRASSHRDPDTELPNNLSPLPAAAKKAKHQQEEDFDWGDSSDSDSRIINRAAASWKPRAAATASSSSGNRKRSKKNVKAPATSPVRHLYADTDELPRLTKDEQEQTLKEIKSEYDKNLQILLWELDCNYVLLEHQFRGVRAIAGVAADFPGLLTLVKKEGQTRDDALLDWVVDECLRTVPPPSKDDRGVLMCDAMGLGKTVQSVCACILRNAIALSQHRPKKPTLIVSPNDAVLTQWLETLLKAGVDRGNIYRLQAKKCKPLKGDCYVLCNRYDLQVEMRYIFEHTRQNLACPVSPLFPHTPKQLLLVLKNQYLAEKGKATNQYIERGDRITMSECITNYLAWNAHKVAPIFETVVIDEAHFLKSLKTYWGMASGILGLHAGRMIPMSGTPFNNNVQDLATLMSFIDPDHESATEKWWVAATATTAAKTVIETIADWNSKFLIRRDKSVIAANLPAKIVTAQQVLPFPMELSVYEKYESKFLAILAKFQNIQEGVFMTPPQRRRMLQYFQLLLSFALGMRAALIHPVLPSGGRDLTVFFSPTRRNIPAVLKAQERVSRCVCCYRKVKRIVKKKAKDARRRADGYENLGDEQVEDEDDALFIDDDDDDDADKGAEEGGYNPFRGHKGSGEIVPIPPSLCRLAGKGIRHFACETCLETMEHRDESCPQCSNLFSRLKIDSGRAELLKKKHEGAAKKAGGDTKDSQESVADSKNCAAGEVHPEEMEIPRRVYCSESFGGFRASAKLESIIAHFNTIPLDEKVLLVSFFKGSLDLLEGMFEELNVEVARFDGDIQHEERQEELERFKANPSCRVLLATVQTCGTGINLVEANHVVFADRFFNPTVLEQCEDRCYRLGQKKEVHVTYHDVSMTIDDVMRRINRVKHENAQVLLADGSAIGSTAGMSYRDISGTLGNSIRVVRGARMDHIQQSKENIVSPLPPSSPFMFDAVMPASAGASTQIPSMLEAIAAMLGYALASYMPSAPPAGMATAEASATEDVMSIGSLSDPSGETSPVGSRCTSAIPMPMVVSNLRDNENPAPMVVSSSKAQDAQSTSQNGGSNRTALSGNQLLDESVDDDSLMDPVVFTPNVTGRTSTATVVSSSTVAQVAQSTSQKGGNRKTVSEALLLDESDDDDSWMEPVIFTPRRADK